MTSFYSNSLHVIILYSQPPYTPRGQGRARRHDGQQTRCENRDKSVQAETEARKKRRKATGLTSTGIADLRKSSKGDVRKPNTIKEQRQRQEEKKKQGRTDGEGARKRDNSYKKERRGKRSNKPTQQ